MEQVSFRVENFEGPLDLLIYLVERHKMTLTEVSLSVIIDQYLGLMGTVGPDELDPTSEFIEMAARLVYMKSAALLPRQDEAEALKRELVGQLIEYQLCKLMSEKLRYMQEGVFFAVREPAQIKLPENYEMKHEKKELRDAFMTLMGRSLRRSVVEIEKFEEIVVAPVVSVSSRVIYILRNIRKGLVTNIKELFFGIKARSESVATFLGLLELMNAKRLKVMKNGDIRSAAGGARTVDSGVGND